MLTIFLIYEEINQPLFPRVFMFYLFGFALVFVFPHLDVFRIALIRAIRPEF